VTIVQALADAARHLSAISASPRLDAELLMAHSLGISRDAMLLGDRCGEAPAAFGSLLARRLRHEPIAYILGHREFWTIDLDVTPAVLIPRADSETLIEAAIAHFGDRSPQRILDLGTGSGALLLAALAQWPEARGLGIDMSQPALAVAVGNARKLGFADRAEFKLGGWDVALGGGFDLILCNPPYVRADEQLPRDVVDFEPASALFAGDEGLDDYRDIAQVLTLSADGVACIEIGATQATAVSALLQAQGFLTQIRNDLAGRDRCVVVTLAA
jgi:release factor glutamine methyltransferase